MKVCVIQPPYSMNAADIDACFRAQLDLMDQCDDSLDLIVIPEYADVPSVSENADAFRANIEKFNPIIAAKAAALARRCHAIVFANYAQPTDAGYANVTHAFDRDGNEVGRYFKAHPAPHEDLPAEQGGSGIDGRYSYRYSEPYVIEIEGLRFGFMTCYDFYMYESFAPLARRKVDIIIGCSHQRTDTHSALEIIGRFLPYNTNAYLIRSSVSLGETSPICGCSMVVAPDGKMLLNMESRVGLGIVEIDPTAKYYKRAGFFGVQKPHYEYIDEGRRPWLYRPGGSMMVPNDEKMPYPRVCAHRGFNTVAPENSLPAFGAAIALGAEEIEFDLRETKDGVLVSCHDSSLDRVSDGTGKIRDYTYEELKRLDFGAKSDPRFHGLRVLTFEEILKKFACTVVMNIHVKIWDHPDWEQHYEEIAALLRRYDCERHCYMMSSTPSALCAFRKVAPEVHLCLGAGVNPPERIVDVAIENKFDKVQFMKTKFLSKEAVDRVHAAGMRCTVFWSDDPEEACGFIDMGVDTILTNDYLTVANAVRKHLEA